MNFLICYEHIVREIENDTLIKHELEKRGYSCRIINFNDVEFLRYSTVEKADVVVTPWLRYDENVFHYLKLAKKPYKLVNLQWEQVYSNFGIKSGLVKTFGQALYGKHLCWGEKSRNRLLAEGISEDSVTVTGAIQLDYGFKIFDRYYLDKKEMSDIFGLDINKKWNLFISSFAYANYDENAIHTLEKKFNNSLSELVNIHKRSQTETLNWIEKLLEVSDCEFIYRPHPSERVDERLNLMEKKYPSFHIISDKSVKQWSKVCDAVNLWISTSNAELSAMGIDYAIVRPFEVPYDYEVESMYGESFVTDYEKFLEYNTNYSNKSDAYTRMEKMAHYYLYDKEYPAYMRVADYLEKILREKTGQKYSFTIKQRIEYGKKELTNRVVSFFAQACLKKGTMKPVRYLPVRSVIKNNIGQMLYKRKNKEELENSMSEYLKNHD